MSLECHWCGKAIDGYVSHSCKSERITLRDEFALAALEGLLASRDKRDPPGWHAVAAYELADAMLLERAK